MEILNKSIYNFSKFLDDIYSTYSPIDSLKLDFIDKDLVSFDYYIPKYTAKPKTILDDSSLEILPPVLEVKKPIKKEAKPAKEFDMFSSYYSKKSTPIVVYPTTSIDIEDLFKLENLTSINGKKIVFGDRAVRTWGSSKSHHKTKDPLTGYANARDISIVNGTIADYEELKKLILNNKNIVQYLLNKKWGVINEVIPEVTSRTKATGPHFHFGPDIWATLILNLWVLNPNIPVTKYIART